MTRPWFLILVVLSIAVNPLFGQGRQLPPVVQPVPRVVGPSAPSQPSIPAIQTVQPPQRKGQTADTRKGVGSSEECSRVFSSVQQGLSGGNVGSFSQHFAAQVYINLRGGESGYYSKSQAYYLLENYLKTRRITNLNFSTLGESELNPYATGSAVFNYRGTREYAQVYVSLSQAGERWVIAQINIY